MELLLKLSAALCWAFAIYYMIQASQHMKKKNITGMLFPIWVFKKNALLDSGDGYRVKAIITFLIGVGIVLLSVIIK